MGRLRKPVEPDSYSSRIAARVQELREAAGLSVKDVADHVEVTVKAVYKWEQGARDIPPDLYPKLAKLFKVDVAGFFPKFPR